MKMRIMATLTCAVLTTAVASAQSYPGDSGLGVERGIQQLNNSGQVGTVTLFRRGARTGIVVLMHGIDPSRVQSARMYRGPDCDSLQSAPTYYLADLRNGMSRTAVTLPEDRLLSGNYNVVVFSSNRAGATTTACGHLY